ncbi:MAG: phosphatase PAP2 family protein [Chlorobiaceae bacterium]|nr:phosphatase PAP2 family protein [Chlorobiaceae bacterium]NTW73336.1 phosphatase PAP2 family protein [Chlorobiaceae bacterium]
MGFVEQADIWLFRFLNLHLVHPAADDLMLFLTRPGLSLHIILLASAFIIVRRGKDGLAVLLLAAVAIGLADFTASGVMKPLFQRIRPCFALQGVRLLIDQPHSWSFASSHAANSAAVASIVWLFFSRGAAVDRAYAALMIAYGLLVAFSRVYLGVHYPGDVLGGIAIGIVSAGVAYTAGAWIVKRFVHGAALRRNADIP